MEARPTFTALCKELKEHAKSAGTPPKRELGEWVNTSEVQLIKVGQMVVCVCLIVVWAVGLLLLVNMSY